MFDFLFAFAFLQAQQFARLLPRVRVKRQRHDHTRTASANTVYPKHRFGTQFRGPAFSLR
jgi:hypothetical protein